MNDTFKRIRELNNEQIKSLIIILNMRKFNKNYHSALNKFLSIHNLNSRLKRRELSIHLEASLSQKIDRLPKDIKNQMLDLYNNSLIEEEFFNDSDWEILIEKFNLGISPIEYKPFLLKV
jgi:hypothetical protein